jgi:DNA polymerase-3 subunit delta
VLHLYFGADEFRIGEALAELRTRLDVDGFLATNTSTLAPRGLTPSVLIQHISTLPFLAAARLVVVEGLLASGGGRNAVTEWTPVIEALSALPPTNHLVLVEPLATREAVTAFGRSALVRAFREIPGAEVREFRALRTTGRDNEVVPWLRARAAGLGMAIEPQALEALAAHVGSDLRTLAGELEKLMRYASGRAVTVADVELLTPEAQETSIFNLVDAVVEGRTGQALVMLRRMLAHGSEEPLRVQAMIARQVRNLVRTRALIEEGAPQGAIGEATGVTGDYPLRKLLGQARATSTPAVEAALRAIERSDHAVKTGETGDELALELLVIRLGEILGGAPTRQTSRPARSGG